jgi:hypothetical protein
MERRDFLKTLSATGVAAASTGLFAPAPASARGDIDIGEVKSVKVDVLSETSWFENDRRRPWRVSSPGGRVSPRLPAPISTSASFYAR